ncbi:MAG: transposase [Phycisphaerales bacterium]|nr:transposase [Phycisphaerales bacterium]
MQLPDGRVRKKRVSSSADVAHELTFSCYRRLKLLNHNRTRIWLLEAIDRARQLHDFALWAYVIMPDHAHVLIYPRAAGYSIAHILKSMKQPVARRAVDHLRVTAPHHLERLRVTRPNGRVEHRFWQQGGGYDRDLWSPEAISNSINYIHNNPVRAGLVKQPEEWRWSSRGWYSRLPDAPIELDLRR